MAQPANTIKDRIDAASGHPTGFDLLRVLLALSIIVFHSVVTSYGGPYDRAVLWAGPYRGPLSLMLPMFFALSGFLVAGSLERTPKLHQFLALRAIRIVPALFVETVLCALILGPLLTTAPLAQYFTRRHFDSYFLNIVGDIHYELPSVFLNNPYPRIVNASLWTVPWELACYVSLAALGLLGIAKRAKAFAVLVLILCVAQPAYLAGAGAAQTYLRPSGELLVMSFLAGIAIFNLRGGIPHRAWLAALSLLAALVCFSNSNIALLGAPFAAYFTAYIGVLKLAKPPIFRNGDYSYGMYLFAFPIQQAYSQLFPHAHIWWMNAAFAIVLSLAYAMFSWHFVEKPVLSRKKQILGALDGALPRLPTATSDEIPAK